MALLLIQGCNCDDCFSGGAVSGFGASVQVLSVAVSAPVQQGQAVVGGSDISFIINVAYAGGGMVNLTIDIPVGYENGSNWTVYEPDRVVLATSNGTALTWQANLSAGSATIRFQGGSPYLIVERVDETGTWYEQAVVVVGDIHFEDVKANTTVNASYPYYLLFENQSGTLVDTTSAYSFIVLGENATWQGFSLSEKRFVLRGQFENPFPEEQPPLVTNGGSSRAWLPRDKPEPVLAPFSFSPSWFDLELLPGTEHDLSVTLKNPNPSPLEVSLSTDASFLTVPATLTIPGNGTANLTVTVTGEEGAHDATVLLVARGMERRLRITFRSGTPRFTETMQAPEVQAPMAQPPDQRSHQLLNLALAGILVLLLAFYLHLPTRLKG